MAEELHESYSGRLSYALSFGRNNYFHPLKWLHFLPWLGTKMSDIQLYYTPSSVNTSVDFSEKLVQKYTRVGTKTPDDYNLGLNRSFGLNYKLLNNLTMKYNQTAKSDMDDYRGYVWMAIKELDPGIVTNVTENLTTSFSPELFTWLKPSFNYSAGYRWDLTGQTTWQILGSSFGLHQIFQFLHRQFLNWCINPLSQKGAPVPEGGKEAVQMIIPKRRKNPIKKAILF
jgi:cell surface protein SprA